MVIDFIVNQVLGDFAELHEEVPKEICFAIEIFGIAMVEEDVKVVVYKLVEELSLDYYGEIADESV